MCTCMYSTFSTLVLSSFSFLLPWATFVIVVACFRSNSIISSLHNLRWKTEHTQQLLTYTIAKVRLHYMGNTHSLSTKPKAQINDKSLSKVLHGRGGSTCYNILYSGKFWIGANFRIFRMMARHTKINTTKSFTFEILMPSHFEREQSPTWYVDRAMALCRYFKPQQTSVRTRQPWSD